MPDHSDTPRKPNTIAQVEEAFASIDELEDAQKPWKRPTAGLKYVDAHFTWAEGDFTPESQPGASTTQP